MSNIKHYLSQKEARITFTLFMVSFCFMLFELPLTIYKTIYDHGLIESNVYVSMALYFLYWLQYSVNFFIYAVISDQFRRAYQFFLKEVHSNIIFLKFFKKLSLTFRCNIKYLVIQQSKLLQLVQLLRNS